MIELQPMISTEFTTYLARAVPEYAEEKVRSGNWTAETALEKAKKEYDNFLPDGLETKDNWLCTLVDSDNKLPVGMIWFGQIPGSTRQEWFIFDFYIEPDHRRNG